MPMNDTPKATFYKVVDGKQVPIEPREWLKEQQPVEEGKEEQV